MVFGAPAGTRILDPLIKSQMLYQLSYGHITLCVHSLNIIARQKERVKIFSKEILTEYKKPGDTLPPLAKRGKARYNISLE